MYLVSSFWGVQLEIINYCGLCGGFRLRVTCQHGEMGQRGMKVPFQCGDKVERMKKKSKRQRHRVSRVPGIPGGMDAGQS